ncbi:Mannose-6-phosphate isomerase [Wickerhamomyces ciferrii]|uniref:Mannose-6-phosphate isomerase n=1 Tax=Wickerhamomyces ciferrii (strain ATCC 14091 / BCRC 22168 / CBS 111 / JCM 3599 / NBRC 0793 / NRRL Y-1031 F-60-10) TaxID=1206466 RepID=K0KHQ1_WICCF|nr:Mannose-6-phosphate isomerase [Wickerhamomyces ciferrii]CCH40904.1 Mannose-6-phosphate isomerase [Wickerhamomyces ciferrii]
MSDKVFRLDSGYQNYDWGKIGSSSAVAQFAHHSNPENVTIDESKPYAELWMGTHPKVPSKNLQGKSLRDIILSNPEFYLGEPILKKYGSSNELPFLFKVLSIEKVLSIQAHPDKELGAKLHLQDPKNYPDDNHKPEMAIAVTNFEGFCGFKPLEEIADELTKIPELINIVGEEEAKKFIEGIKPNAIPESTDDLENKKLLQLVFGKVMNSTEEEIEKQAKSLLEKTVSQPEIFNKSDLPELIQRLNKQFPLDIGLFCGCLLLNHCKLEAGEAMFLQAKDPHAYISGDIIECMAASDNVVRAGFTPKFKDVENLVEMLTYNYDDVEKQKMSPQIFERSSGDGESKLYDPPIQEFSVLQTTFKNSLGKRVFKSFDGPSILIITNGEGKIISEGVELKAEPGYNFFIAPNTEIELITEDPNFTSYRAYVEA